MANYKPNIIDQRMLQLPDILKTMGRIELKNDFFEIIKMPKQNYYAMRRKEDTAQHFTAAQILIVCKKFNINANWIIGLDKNMFNPAQTINSNKATK